MDRIGRYQVLQKIGAGGMATAWLALTDAGQRVVLKIPTAFDEEAFGRLRDEARVGVRLDHPALVQTLDLFEHEGRPVLVLAWIDGKSLHHVIGGQGLRLGAVARIGGRVASALEAIHRATDERGRPLGVVHRDVSSGNILIDREGNARLIDLGIARSAEALHKTRTGTLLGTLPYLAPELLDEGDYGPGTDVWALACVLFEAAVGRHLFAGTEAQIVRQLLSAEAWQQPGWELLPRPLEDALRLLLVRDPSRRLTDVAALTKMLLALEAEDPGGYRQLGERVHALGGVHLAPPSKSSGEAPAPAPLPVEAGFEAPRSVALPVAASPESLDTVYLAEERLFAFDKERVSTVREWSAPHTAPHTAPPVEPAFAPLAPGQELTEPAPGEFVSVAQLRMIEGAPPPPPAPAARPAPPHAVASHDPFAVRTIGNPFLADGREVLSRPPVAPPPVGGPPPPLAHDPRFAPPAVNESLELATETRRAPPPLLHEASAAALYPEVPRRRRRRGRAVFAVIAAAAGLAGAARFQPVKDVVAKVRGVAEAGFSNSSSGDVGPSSTGRNGDRRFEPSEPGEKPGCFTSNDGWFFVYTDEKGTSVVKERIEEVPPRFRARVRCVSMVDE